MKTIAIRFLPLVFVAAAARGQEGFTNFIRQVQSPSGVQYDASVAASGERQAGLAVETGGARFELWTVKSSPLTNYLLDTKYVGAYIPLASVVIKTEDPYETIPRTRADRPYWVDVTVSGLTNDASAPDAAKRVKFLRHTQSYGNGTGTPIDRSQATLLSQSFITSNGTQKLTYELNSVPGANRAAVRGEERYSVFCLADTLSPESQLASRYVQIWPVATAGIGGVVQDEVLRSKVPDITVTLNDLYPSSRTYSQVYKGNPALGTAGAMIAGLGVVKNDSVPGGAILTSSSLDALITSNGRWTIEVLTDTPFGIDRLAVRSFQVDRSIRVNSTLTTQE